MRCNMIQQKRNTISDAFHKLQLRKYGFDIEDGWTVAIKQGKNGPAVKQLANFVAWPVREIEFDDGEEVTRYLDIKGKLASGKDLPEIRLSHNEFFGDIVKSLCKYWGMDVLIKPRSKDDLREAIQVLGNNRKKEVIYTHTGWRKISDRWVFLHTGGAVGAENVRVDLSEGGEALNRYALPSNCQDAKQAAKLSLSLLNLAAPQITYPLFAAAFLAPLCEVLRPLSLGPDFMLFLIGRTQSGKSSLAALFLSLFGDFDKNSFPASYHNTTNSIERTCFVLKDVMAVIDDYHPAQSQKAREMNEIAQNMCRAYGDGAVRVRLGANGKLNKLWRPRGIAISTGEDRPDIGESGQARFVFIDVNRDDIDYEALTQLEQNNKQTLAEFMTVYLKWIIVNWDRIPNIFRETYHKSKQFFTDEKYSGRINESIGKLCGAFAVALIFALENGFITDEEYDHHAEVATEAFKHVLHQNAVSLFDEKPTQRFLTALSEIIATGKGTLCELNADKPPEHHLGCYDESYVYLFGTGCYKAVKEYYTDLGQPFSVGKNNLFKQLKTDGIVECSNTRGNRNTAEKRFPCLNNQIQEVLQIHRNYLEFK